MRLFDQVAESWALDDDDARHARLGRAPARDRPGHRAQPVPRARRVRAGELGHRRFLAPGTAVAGGAGAHPPARHSQVRLRCHARPPAAQRPHPSRTATAASTAGSATGAPHGDGFARRAARFALHLVTTTRATRELAELAEAAQAPVTTGRRIAVVSVRGGAGRSTVTALLGSVFAARRADHVLVADADPDHGSLAWRLGVAERDGLASLAPRLLAARGLADLDALLPRARRGGLRMLPGRAAAAARRHPRRHPGAVAVLRGLRHRLRPRPGRPGHRRRAAGGARRGRRRAGHPGRRAQHARRPRRRCRPRCCSAPSVVLNTTGRGGRAALHVGAAQRGARPHRCRAGRRLPYDRHLAAGDPGRAGAARRGHGDRGHAARRVRAAARRPAHLGTGSAMTTRLVHRPARRVAPAAWPRTRSR